MRYRTKLAAVFISVGVISICSSLIICYLQTRKLFLYEYRSKAISIAATTAGLLDPEVLKTINSPSDAARPEYIAFRDLLRKVRNYNQREDVYVTYIYTLKPSPVNPTELVFAVSAANTPEETLPIGNVLYSSEDEKVLSHLDENYSPDHFVTDQWGTWLRAYAPMYDSKGQYVATLGVDVSSEDIEHALFHLILISSYGLLAALLLALGTAFPISRKMTSALASISNAVKEIGKRNFSYKVAIKTGDEFELLANDVSAMGTGLAQREKLKKNFARYVSSYILEKTLQTGAPIDVEGQRKKITVLFSDIHDFARITEKYPPEEITQILNDYFSRMIEIIFKYEGSLDKFLWDGLMAEFGAVQDDPNQEKHASLAALEMEIAIQELYQKWQKEGKPTLKIGIGIHTGLAIVGNIGSKKRMEYTAIGDTVNVASRLQKHCEEKNTTILISEMTRQAIHNDFIFKDLGKVALEGREEGVSVYSIEAQK